VHSCFELSQSQTFRKRIELATVRSEAQAQIKNPLRPKELFDYIPLQPPKQVPHYTVVLHARFQFNEDLPVV
jgi:hypothetical protein